MPLLTFPNLSWKRWVGVSLEKRVKFILSSGILALFFYLGNLLPASAGETAIFLGVSFYFLAFLSLFPEVRSWRFFLICLLPALFSAFFYSFIRFSPLPLFLKAISPLFFGLGVYFLFLVVNIFNISLVRLIPLFRVAWAVGFLFSVLSLFFASAFLFSLHLSFWQNGLLLTFFSLPLVFSSFWLADPKEKIGGRLFLFCLVLSLFLGELALAISFWPSLPVLSALFLAFSFYVFGGIFQLHFAGRLTRQRLTEYLSFAFLALILLFIKSRWG